MRSVVHAKQRALGQSCQPLERSCYRLIVTRADADLALERPREIREIVEPDGVSHLLGEGTRMGEAFASPLYPVAEQILVEAHTLLLPEDAVELGGAEPAQGCNMIQRDLAVEMRRHMRDRGIRPPLLAVAIQGGQGFGASRRKQDFARRPWPAPAHQFDERGDALAELPV